MLKKSLVVLGSIVFLLSGLSGAGAVELKLKPFLYTQDFEETDPVKPWMTQGEYTVNFKGLTEERAYSGKKSFKLDVTFQESPKGSVTYYYCYIPLGIPAEGKLKFSCRVLVREETTGVFGIGSQVKPLRFLGPWSGCESSSYGPTQYEWKLVEADVIKRSKQMVSRHRTSKFFGAEVEDVGAYIDKIIFLLKSYRKCTERIVVYIDDIKLEGEIPSRADYDNWTNERWAALKKRNFEKIDGWFIRLEKIEKEINAVSAVDPSDKELKKELESQANLLREKMKKILKKKLIISSSEHESVETIFSQLSNMCKGFSKNSL